jgi:hypothetical protein
VKIPPDALIAREKLTKYLLVPLSKSDKSRYLARAGFKLGEPNVLENAIRVLVALVEAVEDTTDIYGTDYTVRGELIGPSGVRLPVVVVWIRRAEGQFRLVTVKPDKENDVRENRS